MHQRDEFHIIEYSKYLNRHDSVAFIGIQHARKRLIFSDGISEYGNILSISKSITMETFCCGGALGSTTYGAYDSFNENYNSYMTSFIKQLNKKVIVIFTDGDTCSYGIVNSFTDICNSLNKTIIAISMRPYKFEGRRRSRMYDEYLQLIKKSENYVLEIDIDSLIEDNLGISDTEKQQYDITLKIVNEIYDTITENNLNMAILEAIVLKSSKADKGDASAQYKLGVMYYNGRGVEQDYLKAVEFYQKAADQGHLNALSSLGIMYDKGIGVERDYSKAAKLYQKAADQGDITAQYILGFIYYNGRGVEQDYLKAVEFYQKAADQGDTSAQYNLGNMYARGEGVGKDYSKAKEFFGKACDDGLNEGCKEYAVLNKKGF